MNIEWKLSHNDKRKQAYAQFLKLCDAGQATVSDIIAMGHKWMRRASLHHHFFKDCSLLSTAECLTYHVLPVSKLGENIRSHRLAVQEAIDIIRLFERRIHERVPVAYITNEAEYCGNKFFVNQHVLVPRSIMSTRFSDFLDQVTWENHRVLDLCTGSGCIGITLALLNNDIRVDLADISADALAVAEINVKKHRLQGRVNCIHSNVFENIHEKYDLIITNPPYVPSREYKKVPLEFKNEPKIALESGKEGLDILNIILTQAKQRLNKNGILIAEVGFTTAKVLKKVYPMVPFQWLKYRRPNGKESLFGMHGVLLCQGADLPKPGDYKTTRGLFAWLRALFG